MRVNKGQFNFVWIFALLAGGAILFLAIYGVMNWSNTGEYEKGTKIAKSLDILTNPMQAGFAEGTTGSISLREEARIRNVCFDNGFGKNDIAVSTKKGDEWGNFGGATSVYNKYLFSEDYVEGFDVFVFSKPFYLPFKVSDLTMVSTKNYCFVSAPEEISSEIGGMKNSNMVAVEGLGDCEDGSVSVCFGSGNCDIMVYGSCSGDCETPYDYGSVQKYGVQMNYAGNLLYAAILSDKGIYDCNVRRLFYRASMISDTLTEKVDLMNARDCGTNLKADLILFSSKLESADSGDISSLYKIAKTMDKKNGRELCGVW